MEGWMRRWAWAWIAIGCFFPVMARAASSVSDEVFGNSSTPANEPAERELGDNLSGDWEVTKRWDLTGRLTYARVLAAPPVNGAKFGDSAGNVVQGNLGVEYQVNPHFTLNASANGSPPSTTFATNSVSVTTVGGADATADGQLRTDASSYSALIGMSYDTEQDIDSLPDDEDLPDPRPVELQVLVNGAATVFDSTQKITNLEIGNRNVVETQANCDKLLSPLRKKTCLAVLAAEKGNTNTDVTQFPITLTAVATLFEDTDVGVTGYLFEYSSDPSKVGFFNASSASRGSVAFGAGLPIEPLAYAVKPEISHLFFGRVTPIVSYERGEYVDNLGYSDAVSLKVKVKITHHWKVWAQVTGERDTDSDGTATPAYSASLGVRYLF